VTFLLKQVIKKFSNIFSERTKPIIKLLRKAKAFKWNEYREQFFSMLQKVLAAPPILAKPVLCKLIIVYSKTSSKVIGATLIQEFS